MSFLETLQQKLDGARELFCEAFLPEITEGLEHVVKRNVSEQIIDDVIETIPFIDYEQRYESLKSCCLRGEFGKTPQFWMTYQKAIDRQHKFHFSININDFDLRLKCWKDSLPLCFATNLTELCKVWHILYYPARKYRPDPSRCKGRVTRNGALFLEISLTFVSP